MPATELQLWQDNLPPLTLLIELSLLIYKQLAALSVRLFSIPSLLEPHHVTLTHGSRQQGKIC
jgi:hypothetical protein